MSLTLLLFLLPFLVPSVPAHPDHVPASACVSMGPDHGRARPQTLSHPVDVYDITIYPPIVYDRGQPVTVRMRGGDIRGFMVQMRTQGDNGVPVGTWRAVPGQSQTLACAGPDNTITHVSNDDKTDISLTWIPPESSAGHVYVMVTIVHDYWTYWTKAQVGKLKPGASYTATTPTPTPTPTPTTALAKTTTAGSTNEPNVTDRGDVDRSGALRPWHIIIILFVAGGALLAILVCVLYWCRNYCILRGIKHRESRASWKWYHPKPRFHIGGRYTSWDDAASSDRWSWSTRDEPDTYRLPPDAYPLPATLRSAPTILGSQPPTLTHPPSPLTHAGTLRSQPATLTRPPPTFFVYVPRVAETSEDNSWRS